MDETRKPKAQDIRPRELTVGEIREVLRRGAEDGDLLLAACDERLTPALFEASVGYRLEELAHLPFPDFERLAKEAAEANAPFLAAAMAWGDRVLGMAEATLSPTSTGPSAPSSGGVTGT